LEYDNTVKEIGFGGFSLYEPDAVTIVLLLADSNWQRRWKYQYCI